MNAVVCLVTPGPAETYFVNRLHEDPGVDLVVVIESAPLTRRLAGTLRTRGVGAALDVGAERVANLRHRRRRRADLDRWFGDLWHGLPADLPSVVATSTAEPAVT